jgi:hypothetical protein
MKRLQLDFVLTSMLVLALGVALVLPVQSQPPRQAGLQKAPDLILQKYWPKSMMVTQYHVPPRSKFPSVDVHNHLGNVGGNRAFMEPAACIKAMDAAGVAQVVNLDG